MKSCHLGLGEMTFTSPKLRSLLRSSLRPGSKCCPEDLDFLEEIKRQFSGLQNESQQKFKYELHITYLQHHLAFHPGMHDPYHCSRCKKSAPK